MKSSHEENESLAPSEEQADQFALRVAEALVFASTEPVSEPEIASRLPSGCDTAALMAELAKLYAGRGVNLVRVGDRWAFRTAPDLSSALAPENGEAKKLSRAALEVLAIIAYHQPVTRAEIEDIRGVQTSKGTIDVLMEAGWVQFRSRRRTPGRPVTLGTTGSFLDHFGLEDLRDLPGLEELRASGFLAGRVASQFPEAGLADEALAENEDPISQLDLEELGILAPKSGPDE